uniref:FLYWCH-type domain-containing protein n=1 Tax=Anopheles christyi TaxID=43041 RepID=A0A182JNL2_9DIPT
MDRRRNGALQNLLNARKQLSKNIKQKQNNPKPDVRPRAAAASRGKRELEKANEPYGYNRRGNLVYQNYSFSKASINGVTNIIYWRCTEYRKQKCRSTLKTMGKDLYIIDKKHNHVPKNYGPIMPATLPIFNVSSLALEVDVSNELTRKLPDVTLFKTNRAKGEKNKATNTPSSLLLLQNDHAASIVLSDSEKKSNLATVQVVKPNVNTVKTVNHTRPNPDHIVKQLSNGHTLMKLIKTRVRGFCLHLSVGRNSLPSGTNVGKLQGAVKAAVTGTTSIPDNNLNTSVEFMPVPGFKFPLQVRSDVERLENAIQNNNDIRKKYVSYLSQRKPKHMVIHKFISTIFSDEALNAYNLHGSNTSGRTKIPMKTYSVFYDCFIDAFKSTGLCERDLQTQLTAAIKHSRNRMRQRSFRARKSLGKQEKFFAGDKSE